jgi:Uma2 family endonuclease
MSVEARLMTAEELLLMPHRGLRHELIRGELRSLSPSGGEHVAIIARLGAWLFTHVDKLKLGVVLGAEGGFIIARNPDTVRAPDVAFVRKDRVPASGIPRGFWPGAPDLAVEVISPGDTYEDVTEKTDAWLAAGAAAVWVVNPRRRTISIHRSPTVVTILAENDTLDGQDVVPGFRCRVGDVFV